jgi:hypothetical protein
LHRFALRRQFSKLVKTETASDISEQVNETTSYLKNDLGSRKAEFDKMLATIDQKPELMEELEKEGNGKTTLQIFEKMYLNDPEFRE